LAAPPRYGLNAAATSYRPGLPTYLRITDISPEGKFSPSPRVGVNSPNSDQYFLKDGDVVFARTGASVGKSYLHTVDNGELVFAGFLIQVRCNRAKLLPSFLRHFANTGTFWAWVATESSRTGQPGINATQLKSLEFLVPTISEQEKICTVLNNLEDHIDAFDTLIAKKLDIKQGAMQQLLTGRTRLPGFDGRWEFRRVRDFTRCVAGGTPSTLRSEFWVDGQIPWMSSGELHARRIQKVRGRITTVGLAESSAQLVPPGSVLIGLAGQGKTRGTVAISEIELSTNQSIAAIFPSRECSSDYLFHNLSSRYDELRSLSTGDGGRGGLNLTIIGNLEVPWPSLKEQEAIAQILSDMDAGIDALVAQREKTALIKTGMMQELLTGRTRLL